MHYYGDYPLLNNPTDSLKGAGKTSILPLSPALWGCTCFSALNSGGDAIMGRNFDWYDHPALLLYTHPPDRYASISMVDISYLGVSKNDSPLDHSDQLTNLPYFPFDGMNEHGLSVGLMALAEADPPYDSNKQTVGSLNIIRILLDNARNLDEAIALFGDYNIDFTGGPPLHYMIMDASRHSAVIEFINGSMNVLRNDEQWQVSTNFVLTGLSKEERRAMCYRYRTAYDALEEKSGIITAQDAVTILENVSQSNTIWSVVYNVVKNDIHVAIGRKYGELHEFEF
jgi:predicted choloylglycine hydrolase